MGKSKKQSKGKKKAVPLVKADCDKTLSLTKTEEVKTKNSNLSCPEKVSPCAESESVPICLDKGDCLAERKSQSKSVTDLGRVMRPKRDDPCLTRSLVELRSGIKPSVSTSSRKRSSRLKNANSEELVKFKSEVSTLPPSGAFEGLSDVKDECVQSCTEAKTEFGKLLIAACKQKLEDESENHNLALSGTEQCKRKSMPSVKACKNFIRASGSRVKQTGASKPHEETRKEEIASSPKVVICPNDCLKLESMTRRSFQDNLKVKPESKKCSQNPDAQQDAKNVNPERSSTSRHPVVAKNSSIASFLAGFASHSAIEKEKGPDLPQACGSVSICRGIKLEEVITTNISLPTDVKDDASDVKGQDLLPSVSLIQNCPGTEPQSLTESHIVPASVQSAVPSSKRRHRSERKSTTKKRSVHGPPKQNCADESGGAVLPKSTGCKSSVVRSKSVKSVKKSENKDGRNEVKAKITPAKDVVPSVLPDTAAPAGAPPILTRSMIKTPG